MNKDPIVEEIHLIREKMLEECGGDLEKLMDRLKARESEHKDRLVTLKDIKRKTPAPLPSR
ncbi:MAG: hypothetical protein Q8O92_08815 [Candidatus Latescibacter sp.]|nr:hypothetical protein [Candidatus Latescibacter sp.]